MFIRFFTRHKITVIISAAIVLVLVVSLIIASSKKSETIDTSDGVSYIKAAESISTSEIENRIREAAVDQQLDEIKATLDEDPDQVWSILNDLNLVVMGDSRVVGFSVYGYMDDSRVLAEGGAVISEIPNYYDQLEVLNPGVLLLSYGLNDVNHSWEWNDVYEYVDSINEIMEELTALLPDCAIYFSSIMPAQDFAILEDSKWDEIPEWNVVIEQNCIEKGWNFFDITPLSEEYDYLYDSDGVHMQSDFYPIWMKAFLLKYLEDEYYK